MRCPVCQAQAVGVVEWYSGVFLKNSFANLQLPGDGVLTVAMRRCQNCGFYMLHDLDTLGVR
jgi:hypothetical protein